jgi:uncharacterized membrane protein
MDPLRFTIIVLPFAVYLVMLAMLNLRQQPFITTGSRDTAALGIGIAGLIVVGPMALFFPEAAAIRFGAYVWVIMLVFYGLCVSLVVLLMRPRLVVYNVTLEQLRPLITEIANRLDSKSRWTADSMIIPNRQIHFHLESTDWMNNVQIISTGNRQSYEGWRELEVCLKQAAASVRVQPNVVGLGFVSIAVVLVAAAFGWMYWDQPSVQVALDEILKR